MYDIFLVSTKNDFSNLKQLRQRFPFVRTADSIDQAKLQSLTTMFWVVWDNLAIIESFNFNFIVPDWDHDYVHVFKNDDEFNGICLLSKTTSISKKEFDNRFFVSKKEIDIQASTIKPYDKFNIDTYQDYLDAVQKTSTDMFWYIPPDVIPLDSFDFTYRVPDWDHDYVHVFKNDDEFNGICLFPKNKEISKKEFENRFFVSKKEIDIQASTIKPYDKFNITSYNEYLNALQSTSTDMFWYIPNDVIPLDSFDFTYRVPDWDHDYVHVFKNDDEFNGICLFPKNKEISKKEFDNRFFVSKKEIDIQASRPKPYDKFNIASYAEYLDAVQKTSTDMFWYIPPDVIPLDSFDFTYRVPKWDHDYVHVFKNDDEFNGICLFPKNIKISKKEFENRFFISKKEIDIQASRPKPYDRFNIASYAEYISAANTASTDMFWCIPNDVIPLDSFDFTYRVPKWDHDYVHVFKNDDEFNGICLFPKHTSISKKEFDNRFFISKKEIDIQASRPKPYDKFNIDTYQDYINAARTTSTDMFWYIPNDVIPLDSFDFTYRVPKWDHDYVHVFKNDDEFNGICLFPKNKEISKKEFENRFFVSKKEIDIQASRPKPYDRFNITTYDEYLDAVQKTSTDMFWYIPPDVIPLDSFDFTYRVPKWDHDYVHVFKNKHFFDGICLFPKHTSISIKEFENRFFVSKKEIDIQASKPKPYDKFNIDTYQDYLNAVQSTSTDMFWCIPNEVEPLPDFNFDLHFNHANTYDRTINHMFKNQDVEDTKYNGIMLMSKHIPVPKREIEFRFLVEKKEHEQVISKLKPYDIVFISYNEPTADINYQRLLSKFSSNTIHRVSGVTGIHAAHLAAAKLSTTPMFWVVDGDAVIEDDFKFDHLVPRYDRYIVHVWHSRNPINDLEYGYGGVKLLPKKQTLEMDLNSTDMTTSISSSLRVMPIVSNITQFNTDAFSTWRSAFRECVKLSSRVILGQQDTETAHRLEVWCTVGDTRPYGQYAIAGAIAGRIYGQDNADNSSALGKINDFNWLHDQFETSSAAIGNI